MPAADAGELKRLNDTRHLLLRLHKALLDAQREGDGFKTYDKLSKAEIKELSDAVNALSEPVSKLAAAVV